MEKEFSVLNVLKNKTMKEFLIDMIIVLGVPIAIISLMVLGTVKSDEYRDKQPCEYFKNFGQKNLPARCIEYYNK